MNSPAPQSGSANRIIHAAVDPAQGYEPLSRKTHRVRRPLFSPARNSVCASYMPAMQEMGMAAMNVVTPLAEKGSGIYESQVTLEVAAHGKFSHSD